MPDFLRYHLHSDCPLIGYKFVDLIIEEKSNIICYIPGTINSKKKIFESHIGTSFSGPYFSSQLDISKKSDIIKKIINSKEIKDIEDHTWDSLAHLSILMELEKLFPNKITSIERIAEANNYKDIENILISKKLLLND